MSAIRKEDVGKLSADDRAYYDAVEPHINDKLNREFRPGKPVHIEYKTLARGKEK